ncbi:MAG: hypothetical protein JSR26_12420 [Proteobacteria bacterium]|nr:hypothetical protein [Pseudomonadota bacterium]
MPACRLAWRRSRWLLAALVALAMTAACAPWLSSLPNAACAALDAAVLAYLGWLLWREGRRAAVELAWVGTAPGWEAIGADGSRRLRHVAARIRGGLALLTVEDPVSGRRQRYLWWPDTLSAHDRRALRLVAASARKEPTGGARA